MAKYRIQIKAPSVPGSSTSTLVEVYVDGSNATQAKSLAEMMYGRDYVYGSAIPIESGSIPNMNNFKIKVNAPSVPGSSTRTLVEVMIQAQNATQAKSLAEMIYGSAYVVGSAIPV